MNLKIWTLIGCMLLCGCGVSRKQSLREIDVLIQKSKSVDCQTVRGYLQAIQTEIRKELK